MRRLPTLGIDNFPIRTRLALIVGVLALPIVALGVMNFRSQQSAIDRATRESEGMEYVAAAIPFLREVQTHRALSERVLAGDADATAALERSTASGETAYTKLLDIDRRLGSRFQTAQYMQVVRDQWNQVRDIRRDSSPDTSNRAHEAVIQQGLFPLIRQVGDRSELNQDPEIASSNTIAAVTESLPRLNEALSQARGLGAGLLTRDAGRSPSAADRLAVHNQVIRAGLESENLSRDLSAAMAADPSYEKAIKPLLEASRLRTSNFVTASERSISSPAQINGADAEGFFLVGGSAIDAGNELLDAAQRVLQNDFDNRIADAQGAQLVSALAAGLGLAVALFLVTVISMTITGPIARLVETADRMSLGELDVDIDVHGKHEIGQLAESLRRMQASLRGAIDRLRARKAA